MSEHEDWISPAGEPFVELFLMAFATMTIGLLVGLAFASWMSSAWLMRMLAGA